MKPVYRIPVLRFLPWVPAHEWIQTHLFTWLIWGWRHGDTTVLSGSCKFMNEPY